MAIRDIALIGEEVLLAPAAPVADPTSDRVRRIARDMRDTLESLDAIAMAAPQHRVLERLFVFNLPAHRIPQGARTAPAPWTVMVNPVVEPLTDRTQLLWERCLSIPVLFARVPRPAKVRVRYLDLDGASREFIASGFLANVLQHETDHLDGVLLTSRVTQPRDLAADRVICGAGRFFPYSAEAFDGRAAGVDPA